MLIVEDEWLTLQMAYELITDAGYEALTAIDGAGAFGHIEDQSINFSGLVTDYHMPGELTGADVVEHMRKSYPDIPMILATANPVVVSESWRAQHRVLLLKKPYRLSALLNSIEPGEARLSSGRS